MDEKEDDELVKTAWEEHSRREEEILASDLKSCFRMSDVVSTDKFCKCED